MPLQAIESQRLYQQAAEQIGDLIRRRELGAGQRLPSERDLARQLGVSRPVVREAMIALEIAGLVDIKTGSGIYVRNAVPESVQPVVIFDVGPSPFEVIAVRKMLEPEVAFAAASTRSAADLVGIDEALELMKRAIDTRSDFTAADRLFHTRIATATRNTVLISIVDQLWGHILTPLFSNLHARTSLAKHHRAALAQHAKILQALRKKDAPGARDAMSAHVTMTETLIMSNDPGA
jgi:DNA-binding FadR family transcriptional regulator